MRMNHLFKAFQACSSMLVSKSTMRNTYMKQQQAVAWRNPLEKLHLQAGSQQNSTCVWIVQLKAVGRQTSRRKVTSAGRE